jgi:hypothetical protein
LGKRTEATSIDIASTSGEEDFLMHSFLLNLSLFAFAIGKCGILTGILPGIVFFCVTEARHALVRLVGSNRLLGADSRMLACEDGARQKETLSPSRKVRRYA